jgi:hypothetical protein
MSPSRPSQRHSALAELVRSSLRRDSTTAHSPLRSSGKQHRVSHRAKDSDSGSDERRRRPVDHRRSSVDVAELLRNARERDARRAATHKSRTDRSRLEALRSFVRR